jgi:hypothetical protein
MGKKRIVKTDGGEGGAKNAPVATVSKKKSWCWYSICSIYIQQHSDRFNWC